MIVAKLSHSERYESLHPLFPALFKYVKENDLLNVPLGRITIQGDDLFINNVAPTCVDPDDVASQKLELHRDYIDVHILLEGEETIGWKDINDIKSYCQEYKKEGDCALTEEKSEIYVNIKPGEFVAVWPEDAHAPALSKGKIRKLIAKIKL